MAHYAFNTPMLSNELPGWHDTLSCPFCLNIAVECIRLPHAEPDRDCGVCACAACVREWITFSNHMDLVCPRCRHPICEVHLKNVCDRPNPGDPLLTRLLANVETQCPHCERKGTVSTIVSHTAVHVVEQHLNLLRTMDTTRVIAPLPPPLEMDEDEDEDHYDDVEMDDGDDNHQQYGMGSMRWLNIVLGLHAADPNESGQYLLQWMTAILQKEVYHLPASFDLLFHRVPMHVLDVCETVWKSPAFSRFSVHMMIDMYGMLTNCTGNQSGMEWQ